MPRRRRWARVVAAAIVGLQILMIVRAYDADHAFFGFQMFPESSEWSATIERRLPDGTTVDIRSEWPGGYVWNELVSGRGLSSPFSRHHADTGLRSTLHFFEEALRWVAASTPLDTESSALVARVTVWDNGRAPETIEMVVER
jgi:hypothetical protein